MEMKNKSHKSEKRLGVTLLLLSLVTTTLFAQPAKPIKGESFLLNGVYYSNIDIEFAFNKEYLEALNSGLVFDIQDCSPALRLVFALPLLLVLIVYVTSLLQ